MSTCVAGIAVALSVWPAALLAMMALLLKLHVYFHLKSFSKELLVNSRVLELDVASDAAAAQGVIAVWCQLLYLPSYLSPGTTKEHGSCTKQ